MVFKTIKHKWFTKIVSSMPFFLFVMFKNGTAGMKYI